MSRKQRITAIICALIMAVSNFGTYMGDAKAAYKMVTPDDDAFFREVAERSFAKDASTKTDVKQLQLGKKSQGRLVTGDDGQSYQITLKSSGQLEILLEGDTGKLTASLTDQNGKGWAPRRKLANGKQIYQLKKGVYYYEIQMAKNAIIPGAGLDYGVTAIFKSAKAKFEDNDTRKKAAKVPLGRKFYGHLAQNAATEYYTFTLDELNYFTFSLTTQITDYDPETFVVTLYNKDGKYLSRWGNPDFVEYYEEYGTVYSYVNGDWWWDGEWGDYIGFSGILPAGTYYLGISVETDKNGKVPVTARYGRFAALMNVYMPSVSVKLSHKQAEYTGKKIKAPKVTVKKDSKYAYLEKYDDRPPYIIKSMTAGVKGGSLKKIGKYKIVQNVWYNHPETGDDAYSYAIFTVTPVCGKVRRVSSKKSGEAQISVMKDAQSSGYQIQIARDSKFKKSKKTINTKNLRATIKGLSSGKKYYVRVRNYKEVKTYYLDTAVPENIYGKWSKTRTVVCK